MIDKYVLDDQGVPQPEANLDRWAKWFESADRVVGKTQLGSVGVSTVFLGLDHSFGSGPPLLYETMVFGGTLDGEMERYGTRAEALGGHERMVVRVQDAPSGASGTRRQNHVDGQTDSK